MNGLRENWSGKAIDAETFFEMDRNTADLPTADTLIPKVDGTILDLVGKAEIIRYHTGEAG